MTVDERSATDGDGLARAVEDLVEQALRTTARRPEPLEVRHLSNRLCDALRDYIDRQIERAKR
jgi:hypothetical protein